MLIGRTSIIGLIAAATMAGLLAQAPSGPPQSLTFDIVSIKPNISGGFGNEPDRPDGGLTMINVPVTTLLARAYRLDVAGLPDWATNARFDVIATANRKGATREERDAMLRAMLADRFKLLVHVENREYDTYDLVVARDDGRLGPGLKRVDADCAAVQAEREAARSEAFAAGLPPPPPASTGPTGPLPPCILRTAFGRMDGQATLNTLATALLFTTRPRQVVNKTGLSGSYEMTMEFDDRRTQVGPEVTPPEPGSKPSVFTALQEDLGLKLVPSRTARPTLIVDRIERPTENRVAGCQGDYRRRSSLISQLKS
jgi:uncharacterized protein (TIGR03435 family)